MGIGLGQILIVFMLVLLFFGAKRLPEMTRDLGRATTEFKKANNKALYNNSNHDILRMPPEIEKQ